MKKRGSTLTYLVFRSLWNRELCCLSPRFWTTHLQHCSSSLLKAIPVADSPRKPLCSNRNKEVSLRPAQSSKTHWCPHHAATMCHSNLSDSLAVWVFFEKTFTSIIVSIMCSTPKGFWVCLCSVITVLDKRQVLDRRLEFSHHKWLFQIRMKQDLVFSCFRRKEILSEKLLT